MFKDRRVRFILSFLAIPVFGFVLLNLTFIFNFFIQSLTNYIFPMRTYTSGNVMPVIKHLIFLAVIILISWLVLRTKIGDIYKSIFSTVPTAVLLVTAGMLLSRWPLFLYSISILIFGGIIFYLYHTKKSWLYYYAVTLVAIALLIMRILRIDI